MKNPLASALAAQIPAQKEKPTRVRNASGSPHRRGKVGQTLYLSEEAHALLKEIAYHGNTTITALLIEGVNLVLQAHGQKPIA